MQLIKIAALALTAFAASVYGQIDGTPCAINGMNACNNYADGQTSGVMICSNGVWRTVVNCPAPQYCAVNQLNGAAGCA